MFNSLSCIKIVFEISAVTQFKCVQALLEKLNHVPLFFHCFLALQVPGHNVGANGQAADDAAAQHPADPAPDGQIPAHPNEAGNQGHDPELDDEDEDDDGEEDEEEEEEDEEGREEDAGDANNGGQG